MCFYIMEKMSYSNLSRYMLCLTASGWSEMFRDAKRWAIHLERFEFKIVSPLWCPVLGEPKPLSWMRPM